MGTNTFLQIVLLVFIGYLTYFFDLTNFTDRIMVVLTTMLVLATITASIQQGLPRTSYYKMIDIFLIVKLNSLVITMGFHTYVAYIVTQAKDEPMNLLGSSKIVKKISPMTQSEDD